MVSSLLLDIHLKKGGSFFDLGAAVICISVGSAISELLIWVSFYSTEIFVPDHCPPSSGWLNRAASSCEKGSNTTVKYLKRIKLGREWDVPGIWQSKRSECREFLRSLLWYWIFHCFQRWSVPCLSAPITTWMILE